MFYRIPLLTILLASSTFAAERWGVTTVDFKTSQLALTSIGDKELTGETSGGEKRSIPLATFVQATRPLKIEQARGMVLCVVGGDRLIGQPRRIDGANLVWFVAGVGEVPVPLERALGILRDRPDSPTLSDIRGEDETRLMNGDVVKGIVTAVAEKTLTITPTGGTGIDVPVDNVRELLLAAPPQGRGAIAPQPFTLRFSTGTVLSCQSIGLEGDQLKLKLAGDISANVPASLVASIEHTGGPVTWLSTRTPAEVLYTPFFEGQFVPQMDRTVTGEPIRLGSQIIQRGIGVHSRTRITWDVQPGDRSFRTRYAIDPALGYADVDVRILTDDKVAHETKSVKAGPPSAVIEVDLSGVKKLTLEVDYGQGYDIQDRLTWIEPAIIRN